MVDLLKELKEVYGLVGIKTEFEHEGARFEEICRLKEITMKAGVGITLKIGGCEAATGMKMARIIGIERIVAPMIESAFALKKFVQCAHEVFPADELEEMGLYVNIETITGYHNYDEMLASPDFESLSGVVIGRGDMCGSMGHNNSYMNSDELLDISRSLFQRTKQKSPEFECVLGGVPSTVSFPFLAALGIDLVDEYESRKIMLKSTEAYTQKEIDGFQKGVEFEILWSLNKKEHYSRISMEEDGTIANLKRTLG
jgi:hypothetical protein